MSVRNKQTVLSIGIQHFKEFKIPLNISHKEYINIVGRTGLSAISIKRSFKKWPIFLRALELAAPELRKKPEPPKPAPKAEAKPASAPKPVLKEAAKPASKPVPKPKAAPKKES
jgi:hypothetical protein